MFENGTIIDGKYEILSKIGQGGMSVIYLAINRKANKQWAIKEVRKDGVKDFEIVKQGLVAETEILKKLNHENLPSIVDIIETQGTFLIIMDYIEGTTLESILKEYGAQPQEDVIIWAKQLCDVLLYLHTRNPKIIYRDMKPSNIMLKPDGTIVLIDFGTAREFKAQNLADTTCLGTQGYAAPEQFGGQGQTDERTDIYCLGATIYHLVTGHNPCEPPYTLYPIRQWNPGLSSGLEDIIIKCTQKNPDDRYQSTAELLYALDNYQVIDYNYQKKQKMKLVTFIASVALSVVFALTGLFSSVLASKNNDDLYSDKITKAENAASQGDKLELYRQAIAINPAEKEAYEKLIITIKSDGKFTDVEKTRFDSAVLSNYNEIKKKNEKLYADICYDIGIMYFLYYNSGDAKAKELSIPWFTNASKSFDSSDESQLKKSRADIYTAVGIFFRDEPTYRKESKTDEYLKVWQNLDKLTTGIASETPSMKLLLHDTFRYAIEQYGDLFRSAGIDFPQMENRYKTIVESVNAVPATVPAEKETKNYVIGRFEPTKKRIEMFYDGNKIGE